MADIAPRSLPTLVVGREPRWKFPSAIAWQSRFASEYRDRQWLEWWSNSNVPDRTVRRVKEASLLALVEGIMRRVGCNETESAAVARHLVDANLSGHESHGVLRIVDYVEWIRIGAYVPNRSPITL